MTLTSNPLLPVRGGSVLCERPGCRSWSAIIASGQCSAAAWHCPTCSTGTVASASWRVCRACVDSFYRLTGVLPEFVPDALWPSKKQELLAHLQAHELLQSMS